MPDINERIAVWRMDMARQLGDDAEILNELESHLRDEMAHRVRQGETAEHALELAMSRIGPPNELAQEFAKSATWLPIYAVLVGTILFLGLIVWVIFGSGAVVAQDARQPQWLYPHVIAILIGYTLCFAIGALANFYAVQRTWSDLSFGQATAWNRAQFRMAFVAFVFTAAGVLLGGVWSALARDQFWSWDGREIGGLFVMSWQTLLMVSIHRTPASRRWLMILGFGGNVIVAYAWFGFISWHLVFVVAAQLPFLIAGLAPSGWLRRRLRTV